MAWIHLSLAIVLMASSIWMMGWSFTYRKTPVLPRRFWQIQGILQIGVLLQGVIGVILVAMGDRPKDPLHYLYGVVALLIIGVQRGLMPNRSLREALSRDYGRFNEAWVYTSLNFLLFALLSRAFTTAVWGF